ncbi:hypothetical protein GBAR_LOCUS26685, partial [Geodia barretti]
MDSLKREALRNQTVSLTDNMNPGLLGPYLYSKKLLTHDEFERLQLPTMTTRDRNLFILQKIPTKGSRAFDLFWSVCRRVGRTVGRRCTRTWQRDSNSSSAIYCPPSYTLFSLLYSYPIPWNPLSLHCVFWSVCTVLFSILGLFLNWICQ